MSAATSTRSCAIWSRSASASCARPSARRSQPRPSSTPRSACSTPWSAPAASLGHARAFRKRLRASELNDKEIEIQVAETPAMPSSPIPACPSQVGMINLNDMLGKAFGQRTKPRARSPCATAYDILIARGERQADRQGPDRAGGDRNVENNGIVFLDEIDKICARSSAHRRRRVARRRAARPAAADRRHDGRHQVRAGEDRPRPVHRLGRLPHRQALRPAARAAGPASDPRRAEAADARGLPPHPHRAGGEPHQAIRRADEDRRASTLEFTPDAIDAIADIAVEVNTTVENIGARRL